MRVAVTAMVSLVLVVSGGFAVADPGKDESGKGRERGGYARSSDDAGGRGGGYGFERGESRGRGNSYSEPRRERRAYKEEYDDGRCKVERKFEKNGDYKEERKCRGGERASRDNWRTPSGN